MKHDAMDALGEKKVKHEMYDSKRTHEKKRHAHTSIHL